MQRSPGHPRRSWIECTLVHDAVWVPRMCRNAVVSTAVPGAVGRDTFPAVGDAVPLPRVPCYWGGFDLFLRRRRVTAASTPRYWTSDLARPVCPLGTSSRPTPAFATCRECRNSSRPTSRISRENTVQRILDRYGVVRSLPIKLTFARAVNDDNVSVYAACRGTPRQISQSSHLEGDENRSVTAPQIDRDNASRHLNAGDFLCHERLPPSAEIVGRHPYGPGSKVRSTPPNLGPKAVPTSRR